MHIEHLGSQEGILQAKMEILSGMKPDGKLCLNGDDAYLRFVNAKLGDRVVYFGHKNADCPVLGKDVDEKEGSITFTVCLEDREFPIVLPLEGMHYVIDALCAVSVGAALGVSDANIQKGLAEFQTMSGRQEMFQAKDCTIIKDCYNAGPESMAAALSVLGNRKGRKIAVLGDMLELGDTAPSAHEKVGKTCAEKADILLCYGPNSRYMLTGALAGGMHSDRVMAFNDRDALADVLRSLAKPGDVILFKGSRGMRMELALERFLKTEE
jgi:UDP-N-acetylmuramoyl-tripeptide--D-alanyl-D-alanine ligase